VIEVSHLFKSYADSTRAVQALQDVSLNIESGEFVAVMGASGSGKSTLLHCLGGLDRFDRGNILIDGESLRSRADGDLTRLRRTKIGFVFQFFHLMPTLTVTENVLLPTLLSGTHSRTVQDRAAELLSEVGLTTRNSHFPHQLSGGEMQRVAVARALIHRPPVLLADEPTGNLDSENSERIIDLIRSISTRHGTTVVLVTHSQEVARATDRIITMRDGRILSDPDTVQP
jgi:putative ABC transport system ATP-binding protein